MDLETILQIDKALSLTINYFNSPLFDQIMVGASAKLTWIPLYLLLAYVFFKTLTLRVFVLSLIAVAVNLILCDQISVLMKETFMRLRPCYNLEMKENLRMIVNCGGQFGFVSSHAANTAGLAVLSSLLVNKRWFGFTMFLYAAINGYSRVYLGKHYLLDVIGGFILGALIALLIYFLMNLIILKFKLDRG